MEKSKSVFVNKNRELILLIPGSMESEPIEELKILGLSQTELVGDNGYFEIENNEY